jgi:hypothetical protein
MEYKSFNYRLGGLMNFVVILCTGIILIFFLVNIYLFITNPTLLLVGPMEILIKMLLLIFSVFFINFVTCQYPKIRINQNGLQHRFLFWWLQIAWKDIKSVKKINNLFYYEYAISYQGKGFIFHYLNGLIKFYKIVPCLVISPYISERDILLSEIYKHIKSSK